MHVAVIDYGSGNLRSVAKAIDKAGLNIGTGVSVEITNKPAALHQADKIVLPGVGSFADCASSLYKIPELREGLNINVIQKGKPFLGICVGMQLMADRGIENGTNLGLGWIPGEVCKIKPTDPSLKIPHIGWNEVEPQTNRPHPVTKSFKNKNHAYFVHSYSFECTNKANILAHTNYGGKIAAVVGRENMVGTQFHPEKSQVVGLHMLTNFLLWNGKG
tara:strand:+ start:463 stop:1116 length:654 start_codon:yes stop_codon:yes gene_type:complete